MNKPRFGRLVVMAALAALVVGQGEQPDQERSAGPAGPALPAHITALPSGARVAIVPIEGMIYDFTLESLKQRCQRALDDGASLIVLKIDTPGGLMESALKISRYIKTLGVPTVAWVRDQAYSAGVVIAAACNWIVMGPASALGDCAPVGLGRSLDAMERAKAVSPLLEEFQDSARLRGYDFALFQAMVELGVELYLVEEPGGGRRRVVNRVDYELLVHGRDITGGSGILPPPVGRTELATVKQILGRAEEAGLWKAVTQGKILGPIRQPFHDGSKLLTLSQDRAMEVGLAQAIVRDEKELGQLLGAGQVGWYEQTVVEGVAYLLTRPWMQGLLLLVVVVGYYLEFQTPGIALPGIVATCALVALLGAPFLVGLAQWWHLVLFLVGLGMLLVEVFVTPGFGLLGVSGLAAMFIGLVLMGVPSASGSALPAREAYGAMAWSAVFIVLATVMALVVIFVLARHFRNLPVLRRLVLGPVGGGNERSEAERAGPWPKRVSGDEWLGQGRVREGDVGQVVAELRPTGRAEIRGQLVDVTSAGQWLSPGQRVRVVEIQGNVIYVEPVEEGN